MISSENLKADLLHIGILTAAILGIWSFISGLVEGLSGFVDPNAFDATQALGPLPGLFVTALLNALVLTWFAKKTQLTGVRLGIVVFLIIFGVMFFMSQIETLYFLDSIQMPWQIIFGQVLAGLGVGLVAALLTIRYKYKLDGKQSNSKEAFRTLPLRTVIGRFVILAFVYVLFYYLSGYFIAWQFADLREYYSGSKEIVPVLVYMQGQIASEPQLILFQIFRLVPLGRNCIHGGDESTESKTMGTGSHRWSSYEHWLSNAAAAPTRLHASPSALRSFL